MQTTKSKAGRKPRTFGAIKITPELHPDAKADLDWLQSYLGGVTLGNTPPSQGAIIGEALKGMRRAIAETIEAGGE